MVSAGTKRKRRAKENRIAEAVEDGRHKTAAERKALGTKITRDVPDSSIFFEDRKSTSKAALREQFQHQAVEQRRASKKARRNAPKVRRSEAATLTANNTPKQGTLPGKKKKKGLATVDMEILSKRNFDKPEGHVGNISSVIRQGKSFTDGNEDVWMSETSKKVSKEIGSKRLHLTEKMNSAHRKAPSIIHPGVGLSVNPTHADHQDKLGEELAKIVQKDDAKAWDKKMMSFDPALLLESPDGEIADTGMKCDDNSNDYGEDDTEEPQAFHRAVSERKTRSMRHKEARKREMASNIAKKRTQARRVKDYENIQLVKIAAQEEADKINGVTKLRLLNENPPEAPAVDATVVSTIGGQKVRNEAAVQPVSLSNELSNSMRGVKMPVANPLLRDRFLSFERRGLIAPPKVLPKEIWRMEQEKQAELRRDRRKRKGRGSRSNLTFWKNGKRVIQ